MSFPRFRFAGRLLAAGWLLHYAPFFLMGRKVGKIGLAFICIPAPLLILAYDGMAVVSASLLAGSPVQNRDGSRSVGALAGKPERAESSCFQCAASRGCIHVLGVCPFRICAAFGSRRDRRKKVEVVLGFPNTIFVAF